MIFYLLCNVYSSLLRRKANIKARSSCEASRFRCAVGGEGVGVGVGVELEKEGRTGMC